MFKDRVFNISFLISFSWHVFCIFAVVLVITPKGFTFNKFPTIAFLGPILEEGTFQSDYNLKPVLMPTPYKEDFTFDKEVLEQNYGYPGRPGLVDESLEQIQFNEPHMQKEVVVFSGDILLEIENDSPIDVLSKKTALPRNFEMEEPLTSRGIIHAPPAPKLPEWAVQSGQSFSIDLKILVSSEGLVVGVNMLATTGYAEIDLIAIKNAFGLVFQPMPAGKPQEGRIKIVLD